MKKLINRKKFRISFLTLSIIVCLTGCGVMQGGIEKKENKTATSSSLDEDALVEGIIYNHVGVVKEAIESGENVDINHFVKPRKWENVKYDTPLAYANACGEMEIFYYLIEQGASLDGLEGDGYNAGTILSKKMYRYQDRYLKMLLEHDYDFSLRTKEGISAIDALFADRGCFDDRTWETAQILLEHGGKLTSKTVEKLIENKDKGNANLPRVVKYLLEKGETTGLDEIYERAILSDSKAVREMLSKVKKEEELKELGYLIAAYCDMETLALLLEENSGVEWNQTLTIRAACRAGNLENVKYLIEEKNFVENEENTVSVIAMEHAEANRYYDVVDYLIDKGYETPNHSYVVEDGWGSLLAIDVINGDRERLEYCLENKIGIPSRFENVLEAALMVEDYETYKYLYHFAMDEGIELDSQTLLTDCARVPEMLRYVLGQSHVENREINETLEQIVDYCNIEAVQILLDAGADPNYEYIPFNAIYADDIDKIKLLVDYGMDVNFKGESGFRLLYSSAQYSNEVMNYLLEQGINFEEGSGNEYALFTAVNAGRVQNVKDLIVAGIDTEIKTEDGKTAYDMAKLGGADEIIEIFEQLEDALRKENNEMEGNNVYRFGKCGGNE